MSLIKLPLEILDIVVNGCLDNLRDIVRLDQAFCFAKGVRLQAVYAEKAFRYPDDASRTDFEALTKLRSWLRNRTVFLSHLHISDSVNLPLPPIWKDLFSQSAHTIKSLTIVNYRKDSSIVLSWASSCLNQLQKLTLKDLYHGSSGEIDSLLHNNAETLELFMFEGKYQRLRKWQHNSNIKYPRLQTLHWSCGGLSNLSGFLVGCPNLLALNVTDGMCIGGLSTTTALVETCPQLRRLRINTKCKLRGHELMQLAAGCPCLEYLNLVESYTLQDGQGIADAVCALPLLHTLVLDQLPESTLLEIAARDHPSLRVIDVDVEYTYAGLMQITTALPQLTGLAIYDLDCGADVNLLAHCGELQYLRVGSAAMTDGCMDAVLDSVAAYCPKLHTLDIAGPTCSANKLHAVIECCSQLRKLRVPRGFRVAIPANYRHVQLVDEYFELAECMPH